MSIFYARVGITCRPCTMLYWIPIIQKWARCRNLRYTDSSLLNLSFVCPNESFPTFGIVPFKRLNENELIASFQRWNGKNINISFKRLNGPIPNIGLSPFKRLNGLSPKIGEGPFKRLNGETCMTFWHDAHEKASKIYLWLDLHYAIASHVDIYCSPKIDSRFLLLFLSNQLIP